MSAEGLNKQRQRILQIIEKPSWATGQELGAGIKADKLVIGGIKMNELDKSLYKALSFLANNTRAEIEVMKEKETGEFEKNVPATKENPIYQTLVTFAYIELNKETRWIITQAGLGQLRDLEQIRHKDLTLGVAYVALAISALSFAVAQGWIKI